MVTASTVSGASEYQAASYERPLLCSVRRLGLMADPDRSVQVRKRRGCKGWQPGTDSVRDFVVAEDELVSARQYQWDDPSVHQLLFIRSLRGGGWRVLRWLTGDSEPVLTAEGNLLAVGVQFSSAKM
jgi:hypothetical protein